MRAGWRLTPIPAGQKGPTVAGWALRERAIDDPELAEYLDGNVGLCHAWSGTCAVDVDDIDKAREWFEAHGLDLAELLGDKQAVQIHSGRPGRAKLLYRLPEPLPTYRFPGLELRCANRRGTTMQDVLPPSVHPSTGRAYEWRYNSAEAHWSRLPPCPEALRAVWAGLLHRPPSIERPKPTGADAEALRRLLARFDPDCPYDEWLRVGMALHHETDGNGFALWDEWSAQAADRYPGSEVLAGHWRSFKRDVDSPVTINSLKSRDVAHRDEFEDIAVPASVPEPARPIALKRGEDGIILARLSNLVTVMSGSSTHRIAFDEFRDCVVLSPREADEWQTLTDSDYVAMRVWLETAGGFQPVSHEMVRHAVLYVAEQDKMDSAQQWLSTLVWDGVPRVDDFAVRYLGAMGSEYTRAVGAYLWTALAGRVMEPGCQADMVPVLIGPQGVGKSRGVQAIVPAKEFFTELRLDEQDDVIARKMRGVLIAELAEMRGLRGTELERVKAFITRSHEKWVPKYAEFAHDFARRFVIVGTTNDEQVLPPDDQHRRWLPIHVGRIDVPGIERDRLQLWAEGYARWVIDGIQWRMADTLATEARLDAEAADPWQTAIVRWLATKPDTELTSETILRDAVGIDPRQVTRAQETRAGRIMSRIGYVRVRFSRMGVREYCYQPVDWIGATPYNPSDDRKPH